MKQVFYFKEKIFKVKLFQRAELAICDLTITPERREVVDFSAPFMRLGKQSNPQKTTTTHTNLTGISILYKKAEPKEANMYAFLDPLSIDLWIYSATLYLAITVVLFFISRYYRHPITQTNFLLSSSQSLSSRLGKSSPLRSRTRGTRKHMEHEKLSLVNFRFHYEPRL